MSDTDDGFDEEAARRELREKYEDEREDREATARMSELLLQGATMTNKHCDRCGSPVFRYEGQEFCPTCQHEAKEQSADQQTGEQPVDQQPAGQQTANQQPSEPQTAESGEAETPTAGEPASPADPGAHASSAADRRTPPSQTDSEQSSETAERTRPAATDRTQQRAGDTAQQSGSRTQPGSEAEAALESSISALARRAASADDPRTATEYLEAAREAAEALAALRHNA